MKIDWSLQMFGSVFLDSLWQGCIVALFLKGLLMVLPERRADLRYLASFAALIGFAFWVGVGVLTSGSNLSPLRIVDGPTTAPVSIIGPDAAISVSRTDPDVSQLSPIISIVFLLWAIGVTFSLLRLSQGLFRASQIVKASETLPQPMANQSRQIQLTCIGKLSVWPRQSEWIATPVLVGWLKPTIIFPTAMLTGMPPSHFEAIFLHELAHFRRSDFLLHFIQSLLESLLFFHPVTWWISSQVDRERERACDDLAVRWTGSSHRYASALGWMEKTRSESKPGALCMQADGTSVVDRLRRLTRLEYSVTQDSLNGGYALLLLSLAAASIALPQRLNGKTVDTEVKIFPKAVESTRMTQNANDFLEQSMIWQDRVVNSRQVHLFRSILLLEKDGELKCPLSDEDPIFSEFPNSWVIEHGLDFLDSSLPQKDTDSDGFTNLEEYESKTAPNDSNSHPLLIEKVEYVGREVWEYPIVFAALPSPKKCQLNRSASRKYGPRDSFFLGEGDISEDNNLRVVSIAETEVIVEFLPLRQEFALPKKQTVSIPIQLAELELTIHEGEKLTVREGDTFSLLLQQESQYLLESIDETECIIMGDDAKYRKPLRQ